MLSTGHGRKNDNADAISVGIAALTATELHSAQVELAIIALRALVEHRDNLVRTRTQTINRLHVLLTQLLPGGAARRLTADEAAALLRGVRPRAAGHADFAAWPSNSSEKSATSTGASPPTLPTGPTINRSKSHSPESPSGPVRFTDGLT